MGTLRCFRRIPAAKSFYGCEGGYQFFLSDIGCLTVPKKLVGTLEFFRTFLVSKKFYEFFLSHITENFLLEFFGISENFRQRKSWMDERGGYHVSLLRVFRLTVPKFLNRTSSFIQKDSGSENFSWMWSGISSFSVRYWLSYSTEKNRGNP